MITVSEALDRLFALAADMPTETVPLTRAVGRVLAVPVTATHAQPPFDASAMDGYGVASAKPGDRFIVIGEAAAGHGFAGSVGPGQAVRIFTGAPVPDGVAHVVIQEDITRDADIITVAETLGTGRNIRPAGGDFKPGSEIGAPRVLRPVDIALIAAMNVETLTVFRQPDVALIATGDELVTPGNRLGPDQIVASNTYGLAAMLEQAGARPRILPIAKDTPGSMRHAFDLASGADLIVTVGGASVGDHDLVAPVADTLGFERAFHKVAMRPGKPLLSGRMGGSMLLGLPGNPVSAMVCGHIFVRPVIRAMLGLGRAPLPTQKGALASPIGPNGPREHYMRAAITPEGLLVYGQQDSSLLSILGAADALVVRPPGDPARDAGDSVAYLPL